MVLPIAVTRLLSFHTSSEIVDDFVERSVKDSIVVNEDAGVVDW